MGASSKGDPSGSPVKELTPLAQPPLGLAGHTALSYRIKEVNYGGKSDDQQKHTKPKQNLENS